MQSFNNIITIVIKLINSVSILFFTSVLLGQSNSYFSNTKRYTIYSEVLQMDKSYQVFLPESYHYSEAGTYPVIFIVDGDYNFYYQTGIIETLANVSEKIPEAVVIGISDNGNAGYKKDCTFKTSTNPNGNATTFTTYLAKELIPEIESRYKVSKHKTLIGHSLGGLFATTVFLDNPSLFASYISIDPSYWWDDYNIVSRADSILADRKNMESNLFITLANTKQMGVHQFVGVLEEYFADSKQWKFALYENEDHGSVGIISIRDGLLHTFKGWAMDRDMFYGYSNSEEVLGHYMAMADKLDAKVRIPPNNLSNIVYYYFRKDNVEELQNLERKINENFPSSTDDFYSKWASYLIEKEELEKAKTMLDTYINEDANAFKSYDVLSKVYYAQKDFSKAKEYATTSINIAKQKRVRQWQLNELQSNLDLIMKELK